MNLELISCETIAVGSIPAHPATSLTINAAPGCYAHAVIRSHELPPTTATFYSTLAPCQRDVKSLHKPEMASKFNMTTPEGASAFPRGVRRSFTEPTKLAQSKTAATNTSQHPSDAVEVLYTHPGVKIVYFTTSSSSPIHKSGSPASPWNSVTERTVVAGVLLSKDSHLVISQLSANPCAANRSLPYLPSSWLRVFS